MSLPAVSKRLLPLWLVTAIALVIVWRSVPTLLAQIVISGLLAASIALSIIGLTDLLLLTCLISIILLINYGALAWPAYQLLWIVLSAVTIYLFGNISAVFLPQTKNRQMTWLFLGFFTAQVIRLLLEWPISYFNRSLIAVAIFYFFWGLFTINKNENPASYRAHFIYALIAVILVVGSVLWTNLPQLTF